MKVDRHLNLLKSCRTDTLYTWTSRDGIERLKRSTVASPWGPLERPLFFARAPVASFGYGDVSIRIKLRSNVRYRSFLYGRPLFKTDINDICRVFKNEIENTVFVRVEDLFPDWIICSMSAVESWSYGTPEHYREMRADYQSHKSGGPYDNYGPADPASYPDILFIRRDKKDFSEARLVRILDAYEEKLASDQGEIFINPALPADPAAKAKHFRTRYPVYFNKND